MTGRPSGRGAASDPPFVCRALVVAAPQREFRSTWCQSAGAVVVTALGVAQLFVTTDEVLAISPRGLSGEKGRARLRWEPAGFDSVAQRSAFAPLFACAAGTTSATAAPMTGMNVRAFI